MKKKPDDSANAELRRQAEGKLGKRKKQALPATQSDANRLVHELEVHQIELEMQNEELLQSRALVEAGLRKYTDLYDFAPVGYFTLAQDGAIRQVNLAGAKLLGVERDALVKRRLGIFVSGQSRTTFSTFLETVFGGGQKETCEVALSKDGHDPLWAHIEATVSGDGAECHAVMVDITERRRVEEALRKSEEQYRNIIQTSMDGFWVTDTNDGRLLDVNAAYCQMTGYTREELLKMRIADIEVNENIDGTVRHLREVVAKGYSRFETRHRRKDGQFLDFVVSSVYQQNRRTGHMFVFFHDITQRKHAEEKLRQSEEQFRLISENVADMIAVLDLDGRRLYNSPSYIPLLGDPGPLQGTNSFEEIHPDDQERIMNVFQETVRTGVGQRCEYRLMSKDSGVRFIESQGSVIKNENGKPEKLVVVSRDVTERKQAEQSRLVLEEQLIQAQKLESIGTLAGGIAHDFNNILGIILGHSTMLDTMLDNPVKLSKSVETIGKAVERGSGLVRQILTFARKANVLLVPVQLNEIVAEMGKMLEGTFPKMIAISLELEKNIPIINADLTQLHQIFLNLCVNARDAMPNGGTLLIRTSKITKAQLPEGIQNVTAAEYVHVCVSDTGTGMDGPTKLRIFEPFFTTKEIGKGTGIGLPVVYGIMKSHHGHVEVESASGHGTTFHLYFPAHGETSVVETTQQEKGSKPAGGSETILFVEDEEMLCELVSSFLQTKGYRVLTAANGISGAEIYAQEKEHIALVVTDMGLPKMSGLEMVKKIKGVNPNARVILASGYLAPEDKSELEEIGEHEYMEKPYLPDELFSKIRQVLATEKHSTIETTVIAKQ